MMGPRPYPRNAISLQQSIRLELSTDAGKVLTSSATPGASTFLGKSFALSDFSGFSALVTVFDQYRFESIEVWLEPINPNGNISFPFLTTCVDLDDAAAPTTVGSVSDHQAAVSGGGNGGHYHKWQPHMAVAVYSGAFTSFANEPASWIDVASPSVQHYGFKAATFSNGAATCDYNLTVRAVMHFRAPTIN